MPLFVCDRCEAIENTAMEGATHWAARMELARTTVERLPRVLPESLCSYCATGTWHGRWKREPVTIEVLRARASEFEPTRAFNRIWAEFVATTQGPERAKRWLAKHDPERSDR